MALIDSKIADLKDGRKVLIRCATESDAAALLEVAKIAFMDGDGMISEADEFIRAEDDEKARISGLNDDPKQLLLIADADGMIVGRIDFHIKKARRVSHWGSVGIQVRPEWRDCGVGNALLGCLLDGHALCRKLKRLLLAFGRTIIGRSRCTRSMVSFKVDAHKDYLKMSDGSYVDELTMETFVRS